MGLKTEWKTLFFGEVAGGTDFSGPIRKSGKRNSKTVVVWAKDINSVRDLIVYPQEKYDENVIPWGGVSYKGLVPSRSPVFVVEMNAPPSNCVYLRGWFFALIREVLTRLGKILKTFRNVQELLECNLEPTESRHSTTVCEICCT